MLYELRWSAPNLAGALMIALVPLFTVAVQSAPAVVSPSVVVEPVADVVSLSAKVDESHASIDGFAQATKID